MKPSRRGPPWALALACLALACGGDDGDASVAAGQSAAGAPASAAAAPAAASLPPTGEVRAWREGAAGVSVLADEAPRGAILAALAEAAEFALILGGEAELDRPLTLRAEREPLEVVLARVLAGVPHALDYEAEAGGGKRLARLSVGAGFATAPVASAPAPAEPMRSPPRRELTPEEQRERAARAEELWATSLANITSSDEAVREDAATWLNVDTAEGFQAATDRLAHDEAPEVRAAAAETLGAADAGAVQPLLQALQDPDPRVVIAALDALEFVGDASTIPHLSPLLKHRDVDVRERTVEAIEFLQ
jgi:hypothetical protein